MTLRIRSADSRARPVKPRILRPARRARGLGKPPPLVQQHVPPAGGDQELEQHRGGKVLDRKAAAVAELGHEPRIEAGAGAQRHRLPGEQPAEPALAAAQLEPAVPRVVPEPLEERSTAAAGPSSAWAKQPSPAKSAPVTPASGLLRCAARMMRQTSASSAVAGDGAARLT